jgi:hypothetical protein
MYNVLYDGIPIYQDFAKMLMTVNMKNGINVNTIDTSSYGAYEAFKNNSNTAKVDCCPETLIDIAEHNDMSITQLDALLQTFNSTKLVLPKHLLKPCNKKSKLETNKEHLHDDIHMWVNKLDLSKRGKIIRKILKRAVSRPEEAFRAMLTMDLE